MSRQRLRFTEATVRDLPLPTPKARVTYVDFDPPELKTRMAVPGLELTVSYSGIKSFVFRKKVNGRAVAVTLGRHPSINVETARQLAREHSNDMSKGVNPNTKKRAQRASRITLEDCFKDYLKDRDLAANTLSNYNTVMDKYLDSWKKKPLKHITRNMVENHYKKLSKASPSSANKTMRILGALFNYANGKYENEDGSGLFPDNPVTRITALKIWHKEKSRKNKIDNEDFPAWFEAVLNPVNDGAAATVSDLLVFILLTGLRRREASNLRWDAINMQKKFFTVYETKNNEDLELPLSDYLLKLLERRKENSESAFVFPGINSDKPLQEPKKQVQKFRDTCDIDFTIHDLRRTFITVAESCEIAPYAIKAMVNHKLPESRSGDITQDYIIWTRERLREPMQKVTDYILKHGNVKRSHVVKLRKNLS